MMDDFLADDLQAVLEMTFLFTITVCSQCIDILVVPMVGCCSAW